MKTVLAAFLYLLVLPFTASAAGWIEVPAGVTLPRLPSALPNFTLPQEVFAFPAMAEPTPVLAQSAPIAIVAVAAPAFAVSSEANVAYLAARARRMFDGAAAKSSAHKSSSRRRRK